MNAIEKLLGIVKAEVGYLEKNNINGIFDKTDNAGEANYTKYWSEIKPEYQGQPWCAVFVTWCMDKAFGKDMTKKLLKHYPYVYCPTLASLLPKHSNPMVGDIVVFYRGREFVHTGFVVYVHGDYFETVEGNTSGGSTIIANGGGVFKKAYYNSMLPGTKFIRPNYSIIEEELTMAQYEELKGMLEDLSNKLDGTADRITGIENPMIYNYIDDNMPQWARETIQKLVDKGVLNGTGDGLGLTNDMLRILVILDRAGCFV